MAMLCLFVLAAQAAQAPLHEAELIFPRNPKHNHGSSIVETADGGLIACWFHGSGERKEDDVIIQGARKRKGVTAWSEPFLMADSQDLPDCNPVLFIDPRGTLWLFWIAVLNNEWGGSLLKYRTAVQYDGDGPPKWDWQDVIHCRPVNLEKNPIGGAALKDKLGQRLGWMTRLHPIMLSDTRMMLGLYSDVFNCSLAAFTNDWGKTWEFSEPIVGLGNIQPSFVKRKDGAIVAFMRENGLTRKIRTAVSPDNGMTWGKVESLDIPNPGSSVECIPLKNGHWVLVCNDTTNGRRLLTVYLSDDEGMTWKWKRALENAEKDTGSFSYPSVIQAADGAIHCTYSHSISGEKGSSIKHARFNEEWIREGK
ncbi:MAG TPA: exo-alpha-sialidase [Candidatus Hydrogenedentes bacterium]|nr:exo-alpha-sialidase [Candidatus Hydrogenedentota bacterium]